MTKNEISARKRTLTIQLRKIQKEIDSLNLAGNEIRRVEKRAKLKSAGLKTILRRSLKKDMIVVDSKGERHTIDLIQTSVRYGHTIWFTDGQAQHDRSPDDDVTVVR